MKEISFTEEFIEYLDTQNERFRDKLTFIIDIIQNQPVIPTKYVKKIIDTEFYEARIKIENEYRALLFSVDHDNIMEAEEIVFINCFLKKSKKDYKKAVKKAQKILERHLEKE